MKRRDFLRRLTSGSISAILFQASSSWSQQDAKPLSQQDRVLALFSKAPNSVTEARKLIPISAESRIREVSAYILGTYGERDCADLLLNAIKDPSERVRRAAFVALQKLIYPAAVMVENGDTALLPPPTGLPPDSSRWCSAMLPSLRDESSQVRGLAAQTLGWLQCQAAVPNLEVCAHDAIEPVRFYAKVALDQISLKNPEVGHPDSFGTCDKPLATVGPSTAAGRSAQLGPFLRTMLFERQGKFTFPGGIPARSQTRVHLWWEEKYLHLRAECEDAGVRDDGDDQITIALQPVSKSELYLVEVCPKGVRKQVAIFPGKQEQAKDLASNVSTSRNEHSWTGQLSISFEAMGISQVPVGEIWRANLIRVESHHTTGFGPETSSWSYSGGDPLATDQFGGLYFARETSEFGFQPSPNNIYAFPLDHYSSARELNRPVQVNYENNSGIMMPPEHLVRGNNVFAVSTNTAGEAKDRRVTITALDHKDRAIVASMTQRLPGRAATTTAVNLVIPDDALYRAIDLQVVFSSADGKTALSRSCISAVPLVSPPSRVGPYALQLDEKKNTGISEPRANSPWRIRDWGPMQMNESYPMSLVEGKNNILYGGTYPGGRLFSFNLSNGVLEDLGSPGPPANHLHDLVASPDGRIFGGLYRPEGQLFVYDPSMGSTSNLGVPVPGSFSGSCQVLAWSRGRIYGIQRGHLFYAEAASGRIVDKGSFYFRGERYLPATVASDSNGNLLGVAGGRLFRFLPDKNEVLISELEFEGWLLNSPNGSLYTFYPDGRLFIWEPGSDRLNLVSRYPSVPPVGDIHGDDPYGPIEIVLRRAGELVIARSGVSDPGKSSLYIYNQGADRPVDLGAPIPGVRFLTALTVASSDIVYGLGTERVYGLGRTPVRLYSLSRA